MKKNHSIYCIIIICLIATGCKKQVREKQVIVPESITVSWEFKSIDKDSEPYTEATLVINGSQAHKHQIGVFYGRVRKILSQVEINKEMIGGTISGFITVGSGRGHEIIVRYNEELQRLIVAERIWNEKLPAGSFRGIKSIPVPEMRKNQTGF